MIPAASRLQAWWRIVLGEKILRKLRSVVDRATAGHRRFVDELVTIKRRLGEEEAALAAAAASAPPPGPPVKGAKRFEMWISLKVGLPEDAVPEASFPGHQVHAVRAMSLKRAGTYFRAFFGDVANVDSNRDDEGHYLVPRSYKHFGTILEFIRDGSCQLPGAYVPSTYDNRPASTEEQELLEFLREAHFYGIKELVDAVMPKVITCRYGQNEQLLKLLRERGVLG